VRSLVFAIGMALIACHAWASSAPVTHARLDLSAVNFDVHDDLTYTETVESASATR
jgi:hypothetical protein